MKASKWLVTIIFVICCLDVAFVAWSIDVLSWKVDGIDKGKIVQGVITKIEGNKITIKDQTGKLMTVVAKRALGDIKGESQYDKHKDERYILRGLQVSDKVKIQGGNLIKIKDPEKPLEYIK